jgi:hypothetical protein
MNAFRILLGFCVGVLAAATVDPHVSIAQVLITEHEAKLPSVSVGIVSGSRGITRGPAIRVLSPTSEDPIKSPVPLKIRFDTFGGAKIDPYAIKVTYLKNPLVDLTTRVKPFIEEDGVGIEMKSARVPPGNHPIRIDVTDSDGRTGSTTFLLKITK